MQYIRDCYGVPAKRGRRVRSPHLPPPHTGTITSATNYIYVRADAGGRPRPFHPTADGIEYLPDETSND